MNDLPAAAAPTGSFRGVSDASPTARDDDPTCETLGASPPTRVSKRHRTHSTGRRRSLVWPG
ncbi:hypothetical protein BN903_145 [Halorubrum sp. AJ67]|nr:hypothetical protein BN903_145 [Halorubrum sp. AJ67]